MQLPSPLILLTILAPLTAATQYPARALPGVVWKAGNGTAPLANNGQPQGTATVGGNGSWSNNGTAPTSRPIDNAGNVAKFFPSGGMLGLGAFVAGGVAMVM